MKKTLFTLILLAVVTLMSAQTLQIEHNGHVYENGETVICLFDENTYEYVQHLEIRNISNNELNVIVEQDIIDTADDVVVMFCWGSCFVPQEDPFASQPIAIPAQTLSDQDFSIHVIIPENIHDVVKVIYHVYDEANPDNKVDIIALAGENANVSENNLTLSHAYPNPASNQVHFDLKMSGNSNINVTVYNLLGQEVKSQLVSARQNRISISVDDMLSGIYFCRFSVNGEVLKTEKFIVKR